MKKFFCLLLAALLLAAGTGAALADAAPKGPVKLESVSYAAGAIRYQVSGLRGYAEIWVDGENTGFILTENGEASLAWLLPEGEHILALYLPAYNEMDSEAFLADSFQPEPEALRAALQALIRNEAWQPLGGGFAIDRDDTGYLLRVSVDGRPNAALTIDREQLRVLLGQGLNVVAYTNAKAAGSAVLRVDLTQLSDAWFGSAAPVAACSFAIRAQEAGVLVTVTGRTEGNETVEAEKLSGVSLIRDGQRVFVTRNGIY